MNGNWRASRRFGGWTAGARGRDGLIVNEGGCARKKQDKEIHEDDT